MSIHGIIPPVATPMLANEDLDLPRFRWFLDQLIAAGVHGLFVLGTNGECYALDEAEKQELVATAVAHTAGRVPVYVGTGAESTRETLRLTRMAEREGAAGVTVITPYYVSPNQAELRDHYCRVAESTRLPVILYNNPSMTGGVRLAPDTVARLAELRNVLAIKDSSGDQENTNELIRVVPDRFAVLQGRDTLIYQSLLGGAKGAVPASANVAPELCVAIYERYREGDLAAAREAQSRLHPIRTSLALATPPGGVKAALEMLGRSLGPCRRPIAPLSPQKRSAMADVLRHSGLLRP
jgi:4-hydroxy-tetrahydrodipicolinate synthase